MTDSSCILVVDDDANISYLVASALRLESYRTVTAASGREALTVLGAERPDLVVLDVMLPDLDGIDVLRRMRDDGYQQPVIFLTARDGTEDKVRGLYAGGDDYVVKPFAIEELVARVGVVLRRSGLDSPTRHLSYADLEIDEDAHRVMRGGREIHLSPTEYRLLRYLLLNADRVLSKAQILGHVWDYDFDGESTVVETFISYLRRKVDAPPSSNGNGTNGSTPPPALIHTVRGVGYCLRIESHRS